MTTLMTSPRSENSALQGSQRPRIANIPPAVSSDGQEAVELAEMAGLRLDPWQKYVLEHALGQRGDGKWAAFEVGLVVSRQNGKGSILEARELAGLFLLGERFIVHSAHRFDTSLEAFQRLLNLIEGTDELRKRVKRVSRSHGEEGIELLTGQRIRFRTRTAGGGRGFTADCIILDEAMEIPDAMLRALLPTLSSRPNPQIWYTGSAVDQENDQHGVTLSRLRERGLSGTDKSLAYFEWSAAVELDKLTPGIAGDPELWAQANPALGIRITEEYVANEYASMFGDRGFWIERLGVGDWPSTTPQAARLIEPMLWDDCRDIESVPNDPVAFAFDVTPDRSAASICVAGLRDDGNVHIEVVEHRSGTRWLPERLEELKKRHRVKTIYTDGYGPAGSIVPELEKRRIDVTLMSAKTVAQACGMFYDAVTDSKTLRHLGTPELDAAVAAATSRPLGDAWAWSRKSSAADISPLVAATMALFGLQNARPTRSRIVSLADLDLDTALAGADQE
jgi:phage terminase large subunit-like protein